MTSYKSFEKKQTPSPIEAAVLRDVVDIDQRILGGMMEINR